MCACDNNHNHASPQAEDVAKLLSPFYKATKSYCGDFHKVFVTGIGSFSLQSMFSGPNHFCPLLELSPEFATLYGFTEHEIITTYGDDIAEKFNMPCKQVVEKMRRKYNGYKIHPEQKDR